MVKEKKSQRIGEKYFELNDSETVRCQNLWDAAKPLIRKKLINGNL